MACFHCECKRPAETFFENERQEKQHVPQSRLEKISNRQEVSNAWNFDFDDDESDGADVAAFEHADSSVTSEGSRLDNQARGDKLSRDVPEREYSDTGNRRPGVGFDDFIDEEDDIDSYELDTSNNNSTRKSHSVDFSDIEGHSGSDDVKGSDHRSGSPSYNKRSKLHQNEAFSCSEDDFDSDEDISAKKDWKSSHIAGFRQKDRGRGLTSRSKGLSYGSDEELGLDSDDEDLTEISGSRSSKGSSMGSRRKDFQRRGSCSIEAGSDFDDIDTSSRSRGSRDNQRENYRRGSDSRARGNKYTRENELSDFDDIEMSSRSRGSRDNQRENYRRGSDSWARGNKYARENELSGYDDIETSSRSRGSRENYRRGSDSQARGNKQRENEFKSNNFRNGRNNTFYDDFDKPSHGSRGTNQRFHGNDRGGRGTYGTGANKRASWGPKEEYRKQPRGRYNEYDAAMDKDHGEFRNSRRIIER